MTGPRAQPSAIPDDFADWLRLLETPGLGRDKLRRLLAACGSPQAVLQAPPAWLRAQLGSAAAAALAQEPAAFAERLAAATAWLQAGPNRHVLTLADAAYPAALLQTADPPLLLYVQGSLAALARGGVAVVGSRHATAQGLDNARQFAAFLGRAGLQVVSGLAAGIDAAAHEGALGTPGGTLAVVGTGLDSVYPARHRELAQRIAEQGALVSEYAPGMPPLRENFPRRNRIIAGLTQGTLVVEAALASGSLITARLALEAGREVFAIPGSIHAAQSKGCHALIKQGAKLVETAQDILEELQGTFVTQRSLPLEPPDRAASAAAEPANPSALDPAVDAVTAQQAPEPKASDPVLAALGEDPQTLDRLIDRTGWPAAELSVRLLELELEGRVARLPGGLYQQRHAG
jgi:DNA processing protein